MRWINLPFFLSIWAYIFCISCEYAITRPASTSLFLDVYSSSFLPYVWLMIIPFNFLVITFYEKYLSRLGCKKMFILLASVVVIVNFFCGLFPRELILCQMIVREVYILLMFKQIWSLVSATTSLDKAKKFYGVLFGIGSIGSITGSFLAKFLALHIGTTNIFFATIPLYMGAALFYFLSYSKSSFKGFDEVREKSAFSLIKTSPLLVFVLILVIAMQISSSLAEYQFNIRLEKHITEIDARTVYYADTIVRYSGIIGLLFQWGGVTIILKAVGLKFSHLLVPALLCTSSFLMLLTPSFAISTINFSLVKAFDYSFFGIIKEMLYLPMDIREKFRAKAFIDVFASRSAKALSSCFLLCMQFLLLKNLFFFVGVLSIFIYVLWLCSVLFMFKHYEKRLEYNLQ